MVVVFCIGNLPSMRRAGTTVLQDLQLWFYCKMEKMNGFLAQTRYQSRITQPLQATSVFKLELQFVTPVTPTSTNLPRSNLNRILSIWTKWDATADMEIEQNMGLALHQIISVWRSAMFLWTGMQPTLAYPSPFLLSRWMPTIKQYFLIPSLCSKRFLIQILVLFQRHFWL